LDQFESLSNDVHTGHSHRQQRTQISPGIGLQIKQLKSMIEAKESILENETIKIQKEVREMKEQLELLESIMLKVGEYVTNNNI
jgi:hypothetical protein